VLDQDCDERELSDDDDDDEGVSRRYSTTHVWPIGVAIQAERSGCGGGRTGRGWPGGGSSGREAGCVRGSVLQYPKLGWLR